MLTPSLLQDSQNYACVFFLLKSYYLVRWLYSNYARNIQLPPCQLAVLKQLRGIKMYEEKH